MPAPATGSRRGRRSSGSTSCWPEPLVAAAGDDRVVFVGDDVAFDAGASRPSALISGYHWDFGDGSAANGATASHVFDAPGTYDVELVASIGATTTAADTATVTVRPIPAEPGLVATVRSTGALLAGAELTVILPTGERLSAVTDTTGTATLLGVADGPVTAYVYANGYRPTAVQAEIVDGSGSLDVALGSGGVATSIDRRRLTLEEIVAAGIDVTDPANTLVYEFEIRLNIDGFPRELSTHASANWCGGGPIGGGGGGGGGGGQISYDGVPCRGSCTVTTTTGPVDVSVHCVPATGPVAQYLVIPGARRGS